MGPRATAECYLRIIRLYQKTGRWKDVDFPPIVVESVPFPNVVTETPLAREAETALANGLRNLRAAHADFAIIACNSAHSYLDRIDPCIIPVIDVRGLVATELARRTHRSTLLLATHHTVGHGVFKGIELELPRVQEDVQAVIIGVLKGEDPAALSRRLNAIVCHHAGIDSVLLGCTELSCLRVVGHYAVIDSLDLLVREAVARAGGLPVSPELLTSRPER